MQRSHPCPECGIAVRGRNKTCSARCRKARKNAYDRRYCAQHREKENARHRRYYAEHREEWAAYQRRYCAEHREEAAARKRRYYAEHRVEEKIQRKMPPEELLALVRKKMQQRPSVAE